MNEISLLLADVTFGNSSSWVKPLIRLAGLAVIFWVLWLVLDWFAFPEPGNKILRGILVLAGAIGLIYVVLAITG